MMLMTKFGKFKLRLIASINLSALLAVLNIASTTSNYWLKFIDPTTGDTHYAGIWRSCNDKTGDCGWRNGIFESNHSLWSWFVRILAIIGTIANLAAVVLFIMAFVYKINKKSKLCIKLMDIGNYILVSSFIILLIGLCVFVSNNCNFSVWLHVIGMVITIITSNMLTRTFTKMYFKNTRVFHASKSVETAISKSNLNNNENGEEKIALTPVTTSDANTNTESGASSDDKIASDLITTIEMNKVSETNGSNEALIPAALSDAPNAQSDIASQQKLQLRASVASLTSKGKDVINP